MNRRAVTFQEALEWCDGQTVVHDGISGKVDVRGNRPYQKVYHEPDAKGKRTEAYRKLRAELRDDWSTDLSESAPEVLCDIMTKLGVETDYDRTTGKTTITVPEK